MMYFSELFVSNSFCFWCRSFQTVLNDLSKEVGSKVTIGNFFRMQVGEGIERYNIFVPCHLHRYVVFFFVALMCIVWWVGFLF